MSQTLTFHTDPAQCANGERLLVLGRKNQLLDPKLIALLPEALSSDVWRKMVESTDAGDQGRLASHFTASGRIFAGILPEACSRHNAPSRAWAISHLVKSARGKDLKIIIALTDHTHAFAAGLAVAKSIPLYSGKSRPSENQTNVLILGPSGIITDLQPIQEASHGVQVAAELVDLPPNILTTDALVARARHVADEVKGVELEVISGAELADQGFGGIWAVGRASMHAPAMVVLDWSPSNATHSFAWVGKGIVYDTGGLSIKSKTGMVGMKTDMGGAAAVLGAFQAAVRLKVRARITAILCVAENAVGPGATRPDDIITMFSGRTVEINNTDAEGRLVLADGLAWAARERDPDYIIDMATLTGAQGVATGKLHAALYCSNESLEQAAVSAGQRCGDLVHPLPYAPELYRKEFRSNVADMRNSVKDRSNAQASCAGQFLRNHLTDYKGGWLHVDIAGPAVSAGRGTGFGVGLLLSLANIAV